MCYYNKETNYFNGLEENISLKENINFINSFDLLNNYLIIQYKFTNNSRVVLIKIWNINIYKGIQLRWLLSYQLKSFVFKLIFFVE